VGDLHEQLKVAQFLPPLLPLFKANSPSPFKLFFTFFSTLSMLIKKSKPKEKMSSLNSHI
jgi:hypothetical protein